MSVSVGRSDVRDPARRIDVPRIHEAVEKNVHWVDYFHMEPAINNVNFHETSAVEPFLVPVYFFQDVEVYVP